MRYVSHVTAALTPALRLLLTEPGAQATDPLRKTLLDRQHQVHGLSKVGTKRRGDQPCVSGPLESMRAGRSLPFAARNDRSGAGMRYVSHVTAALTRAKRLLLTEPGAQATDPLSKTLLDRQHQVHGLSKVGTKRRCDQPCVSGPLESMRAGRSLPFAARNDRSRERIRYGW